MESSPNLILPLLSTPRIISSQYHHHHPKSLCGLVLLICAGLLSVWAANESSKGFAVTVTKASETSSLAGQRFNLMYVSNGKAARILIRANLFVEDQLLDKSNVELNVRGITLQLSGQSMSSTVEVAESKNEHEFVLSLNPALLLEPKSTVDADMAAALLRGMTRVRMWNFNSQWGAAMSVAVAEEMEESVILKANKVHLTYFHRLIG